MNQAITRLKCPVCGKLILVVSKQQIDGISPNKDTLTCPGCKSKRSLSEYKMVTTTTKETEYPDSNKNNSAYPQGNDDNRTLYQETGKQKKTPYANIGQLRLPGGEIVQLKEGVQVIGRLANNPPYPDIKIPEQTRRMSRQHLIIEVKAEPGVGYVHRARLFKQKVNSTAIGGAKMDIRDGIKLHNGDILRLPGADIRFEQINGEPRQDENSENTILDF